MPDRKAKSGRLRRKVLRVLVMLLVALALPLQELAAVEAVFCHALDRSAAELAPDLEPPESAHDETGSQGSKDGHCGLAVNTTSRRVDPPT